MTTVNKLGIIGLCFLAFGILYFIWLKSHFKKDMNDYGLDHYFYYKSVISAILSSIIGLITITMWVWNKAEHFVMVSP